MHNKKLPINKSQGTGDFTGEFNQTSEEGLTPILHKLFQKLEEEGTLTTHFMRPEPKTSQGKKTKQNKNKKIIYQYLL